MKREIYEIKTEEKSRVLKRYLCVETDINNFAKITHSVEMFYPPSEDMEPTYNSTNNFFFGKINEFEDLITIIQTTYPNLVKENLTLLSAVKWTDTNFRPAEQTPEEEI